MKHFKSWLFGVYGFPTLLFITLVIALILIPDPQPVTRAADPLTKEINQDEYKAAVAEFDLENTDSRAIVGVSSESYDLVEVGTFKVTWYCPCTKCTDGDGITATGTQATEGITLGADWSILPPGAEVYIEGIGWRVVEDTGGAIKGQTLDVFVNDHQDALAGGMSYHKVYVKEENS